MQKKNDIYTNKKSKPYNYTYIYIEKDEATIPIFIVYFINKLLPLLSSVV